jgi:hypothetical protein
MNMTIEISPKADCLLIAVDMEWSYGHEFMRAWLEPDGYAQIRAMGFRYAIGLKARPNRGPPIIATGVRDLDAVIKYLKELMDNANRVLNPRMYELRLDGLQDSELDTVADALVTYAKARNDAAFMLAAPQGHA